MIAGNHEQYGDAKWREITGFPRSFTVECGNYVFILWDSYGADLDPTCLLYTSVKGPGKVCQPHIHSYFELFYCRGGSIVYICNEERIHLDEDDIIIVYPSVVHYTIAPRDVDITKFTQHVIKFSAEFLLPQLQTPADIQYLLCLLYTSRCV